MPKLNLSAQQIRSIQQSPKGKLPSFINVGVERGTKGSNSVFASGRIGPRGNHIGGILGVKSGKPFGAINVKGKTIAKFGSKK